MDMSFTLATFGLLIGNPLAGKSGVIDRASVQG